MNEFKIIDMRPLSRQITMVIFSNPDTKRHYVQILPVSMKLASTERVQELLERPAKLSDDEVTVSVEIEKVIHRELLAWCEVRGVTAEQFVQSLFYFCAKPENTSLVRDWLRMEMIQQSIDVDSISSITIAELEQDVEAAIDRVVSGDSPILIRNPKGSDLLLFGWEDYKNRFSALYTPEEFAEVEKACREYEEG